MAPSNKAFPWKSVDSRFTVLCAKTSGSVLYTLCWYFLTGRHESSDLFVNKRNPILSHVFYHAFAGVHLNYQFRICFRTSRFVDDLSDFDCMVTSPFYITNQTDNKREFSWIFGEIFLKKMVSPIDLVFYSLAKCSFCTSFDRSQHASHKLKCFLK